LSTVHTRRYKLVKETYQGKFARLCRALFMDGFMVICHVFYVQSLFFPVVKCPPLNSLDLATVSNVNCIKQSMVFDSGCRFDCPAGYEFNVTKSQSATRYCKVDGTWDGQYQVCKGRFPLYIVISIFAHNNKHL
jgi:hypothetical protein